MLIGPESCLRRIPAALDRKQAFFLEGVRVSVEMIELVYRRLEQTLLATTTAMVALEAPGQERFTQATSDAWFVVDVFHRLGPRAAFSSRGAPGTNSVFPKPYPS